MTPRLVAEWGGPIADRVSLLPGVRSGQEVYPSDEEIRLVRKGRTVLPVDLDQVQRAAVHPGKPSRILLSCHTDVAVSLHGHNGQQIPADHVVGAEARCPKLSEQLVRAIALGQMPAARR